MSENAVLLLKSDVKVKDIQNIVNENFKNIETDVWTDLSIIEIALDSGSCIDIEEIVFEDLDESDKIYCQNEQIKIMYYIDYEKEDLNTILEIVKLILDRYDGLLGNDTENFEPVFSKDELGEFKIN